MDRSKADRLALRAGPSIRRTARLRSGFTLTELLIATAITLIFGAMAVATLRYGSSLWRSAHRRGYAYDMATFIFHQVEDDLSAAKPQYWSNDPTAFDTRVRFYVDRDRYYALNPPSDPDPTLGRQRLRFVRGIPEDTPNQLLRQAGDGVDNDGDGFIDPEHYTLKDDPIDTNPVPDGVLDTFDGHVDEDLMPLEGMYEVAYLRGLDATPGTGDAHTLYRGVLSPIGEPGNPWVLGSISLSPALAASSPGYEGFNVTLFDGNYIGDDATDTPALAAARVQAKAVPLSGNILHFEVRCWTQYTTTWDAVPFWRWFVSPVTGGVFVPCGPALTWDSDRLLGSGPVSVMDWGYMDPVTGLLNFPDADDDGNLTPNSTDANYVRDNVFPRAIMVVVVTDPTEEYPEPRPLTLAGPILAGATTIPVIGNMPAYSEAWPYILIQDPVGGDEWVRFTQFDSATNSFVLAAADPLAARGVRGTPAVAHAGAVPVKLGYTFSRVFFNPALREQ